MSGDLLFHSRDLRAALDAHERELASKIAAIPEDEFLNTSPEDLEQFYLGEYLVDVPTLDRDGIVQDHKDIQVDVRGDPRRIIMDESRPVLVPGTRFTLRSVPRGRRNLPMPAFQ